MLVFNIIVIEARHNSILISQLALPALDEGG